MDCFSPAAAYRNPGSDDRFYDSRIQGRIAEQAAHVTSQVQLLGSLAMVWECIHHGTVHALATVALTALKALDTRREHWDVELQRCAHHFACLLHPSGAYMALI